MSTKHMASKQNIDMRMKKNNITVKPFKYVKKKETPHIRFVSKINIMPKINLYGYFPLKFVFFEIYMLIWFLYNLQLEFSNNSKQMCIIGNIRMFILQRINFLVCYFLNMLVEISLKLSETKVELATFCM